MKFSEEDKDKLFRNVYSGKTSVVRPSKPLYDAIKKRLSNGVKIGFGNPDYDSVLLEDLVDNVYYFSAAKTFQQIKDMQEAIKSDGLRTPFTEFKKKADDIFDTYNKTWLKTEYETAVGQSQNAELWDNIIRDEELFPILTYRTTADERVCKICAPLDGFTARVNDPIWAKIMPSNHYSCECTVSQHQEGASLTSKKPDIKLIPKEFQFNPGATRVVFPDSHPYFQVEKKYEKIKENNFNQQS